MLKRAIILTIIIIGLIGVSVGNAEENLIKVHGSDDLRIATDTIKHITFNTDNVVKCKVIKLKKDYTSIDMYTLIDTDNKSFCIQTMIFYDILGNEKWRSTNDINVIKNWSPYSENGDIDSVVKTIREFEEGS